MCMATSSQWHLADHEPARRRAVKLERYQIHVFTGSQLTSPTNKATSCRYVLDFIGTARIQTMACLLFCARRPSCDDDIYDHWPRCDEMDDEEVLDARLGTSIVDGRVSGTRTPSSCRATRSTGSFPG